MEKFKELWSFMRVRKQFWLAPILIFMFLLGLLLVFSGNAGLVSPFMYVL